MKAEQNGVRVARRTSEASATGREWEGARQAREQKEFLIGSICDANSLAEKRWTSIRLSHFLFTAFYPVMDQKKKKRKSASLLILEWNMTTFLCNATQ